MNEGGRLALASLGAVAILAFAPPAGALERQWHVGADAGLATLSAHDRTFVGFGGGAHATYGFNDWLNFELSLAGTRHATDAPGDPVTLVSATAAAFYTLDVIEWVPYFGIFGGGYRTLGAATSTGVGGGFALGLDWQLRKSWSLGAQLRLGEVFLPAATFGTATYSTAMLRAEYVWGF